MRKLFFVLGLLCFICFFISCASKKDLGRIDYHLVNLNKKIEKNSLRIAALENEIKGVLSSPQLDLLVQVGELQNKVNELTGKYEECIYYLERLPKQGEEEADLGKKLNELGLKLEAIEKRLSPSSTVQKEKVLYKKGLDAFRQGSYDEAIKTFNQFLLSYPNSSLAANALFWLGQAYFAQKRYEEAILSYQNKVPAALFKQAKAFFVLGDDDTAQILLREVIEKYPKTNEAELAQKELETIKR
jgi:tol-pal system protein YbgF